MTGTGKALAVLWLVIMPALGLTLLFGVYLPQDHPAPRQAPQPFSCASMLAGLSNIDAGGQIAPACGQTPYPDAP